MCYPDVLVSLHRYMVFSGVNCARCMRTTVSLISLNAAGREMTGEIMSVDVTNAQ